MVNNFVPEWVKDIVDNKKDCSVCGMVHLDDVVCDYDFWNGMPLRNIVRDAYAMAKSKGWWDEERDIPHCLALIHSEVSEALEEYRKHGLEFSYDLDHDDKPEGFRFELADIIIRVADLAGHLNIDLSLSVKEKMNFNACREYRHGNKRA